MSTTQIHYSDDQAQAYDTISDILRSAGVDIENSGLTATREGKTRIAAVIGKAGSGKTLLLAQLYHALKEAGMNIVSGDYEARSRKDRRTLAILAPTNKAASVLRNRGVPATTIHRILYTPMYDPEYEKIAEWLGGNGPRPEIEGVTDISLDRAHNFYASNASIPGALAAAGLIRWMWGLLMKARCWMQSSWKICKRYFPP
jgi:exodeoxyribonuclease-5